jgi:Fe-S-cluster containining protein
MHVPGLLEVPVWEGLAVVSPDQLSVRQGTFSARDKFKFLCHNGLQCFGKCCRDINIFLTPYDVLGIKKHLNITSWEFLEKYTVQLTAGHSGFPVVIIKMREDADLVCPFLTSAGCSIYSHRPWSCRMAPLDIRGEDAFRLAFDPSFCHGLMEDREWDAGEWMRDQGLEDYDPVGEQFSRIPLELKLSGRKDRDRQVMDVFYNTCYNLDLFRKLVSKNFFLYTFGIPRELIEKVAGDDIELLKFGIDWLLSGIEFKKAGKMMVKIKQ